MEFCVRISRGLVSLDERETFSSRFWTLALRKARRLKTRMMRNSVLIFTVAVFTYVTEGQTVGPVDISGFGKNRLIQAVVTQVTSVECKGSSYLKNGTPHHDDLSYDVRISGSVIFKNRSQKAVFLYKNFNPALTERIAASAKDIILGRYITGFDGDRMAMGGEPKKVSIDDFIVIDPGGSYTASIRATVFASTDLKKPLHTPGKYWIQLGIDARPDEFYFNGEKENEFRRSWRSRGYLVNFILTQPFSIDIALNSNAPVCKE